MGSRVTGRSRSSRRAVARLATVATYPGTPRTVSAQPSRALGGLGLLISAAGAAAFLGGATGAAPVDEGGVTCQPRSWVVSSSCMG
jgi:hypothetical protein